jgi:glutamine synthetase
VSAAELTALVCCDLGGLVRGRGVLTADLGEYMDAGVGWVPANFSLTPYGPLAERTPFGSVGDVRLRPDPETRVRVEADTRAGIPDPNGTPLDLILCDVIETDGRPWECCPRRYLREALADLERECGADVQASFEHEFVLSARAANAYPSSSSSSSSSDATEGAPGADARVGGLQSPAPFSLEALRCLEPLAAEVMGALVEAGVQPERIFSEFAPHQYEIPVEAAPGVSAADRAVVLKEVVREVARRRGWRASFTPLPDPRSAGSGAHVHIALSGADGEPLLYDAARAGALSELGGRFAAGVLAHADALAALCAPSPVSAARLRPHRWSAGARCVGERNREALLRIPPVVGVAAAPPERQLRLEYRGADGAANPYLALGALVRAGLDGLRRGLEPAPVLDRDPAELDASEAERYGVGAGPRTLEDALRALAEDEVLRGSLGPTLYEAYAGLKQAECDAVAGWDLGETCRRYVQIY